MDATVLSTTTDPAAASWVINDPIIRLRIMATERVFEITASDRWLLGAAPDCSIQLDDPSGRVSRRHAVLARQGESWTMHDLGSTNGLRQNRVERPSFQLAPGDEIELGGLTLVAESRRSIELRELLRRWLGWSAARLVDVDRALREVRDMAHLRAVMILRGEGSLVGVARRLHRIILGERPFIALGPKERGLDGLDRAITGTLYLDAGKLPRDLAMVLACLNAPDTCVRLVIAADSFKPVSDLAAVTSRIVTIRIPALATREAELDPLLEAYGLDAAEEFGVGHIGFRPHDFERIRARNVSTLEEVEDITRRLVALRHWGVSGGAKQLGITHGALSRWAQRHRLPT